MSAGRMAASQAGSLSTTARPRGGGSQLGWKPGQSGGDKPCWHARSYRAGPNTCHCPPRQSSSAACTAYRGVPHGSESPGTVGDDSQRQPWLRLGPPSPPCACGINGCHNGRHGSTQYRGPTGNSRSQTRPHGHTRSRVSPHCPYPHSSFGLPAPLGGAQPPTLQAPLSSSWRTMMMKGTTPTMGYWEPLARIVEWPREDGNDVREIRAADRTRHRLRVRV